MKESENLCETSSRSVNYIPPPTFNDGVYIHEGCKPRLRGQRILNGAIDDSVNDKKEIIRCKDCQLRKTEQCAMQYRCSCGEQHTWENDWDYCSFAVRRG